MEKTRKITTITLYVLMAISVLLFVLMVSSIDDGPTQGSRAMQMITMNINWSIFLFVASALITVGFALVQMFSDKTKALNALGSVGILAVILLVSYFVASDQIPTFFGVEKFVADGTLTESVSKWIGTGLYVTYILFAGAFLSIIGFGAASIFKR
ncbi:MAG: hypothetical protein PF541_01405 [Prolixibacteraceae bacterium]|jgi:hypothetical protein|nr:hypothetical protein [Prolixibacteraceae bacterium]